MAATGDAITFVSDFIRDSHVFCVLSSAINGWLLVLFPPAINRRLFIIFQIINSK